MCEKSHARVKSKTLRPGLLESCEGFRMLDNHSANVKAETVCAQMKGYKGKDLNKSSSPRVQQIPTSFQFGLNQLLQMLCWRRWFWGYLEEKKLKNNGKQNDDQSWRLATEMTEAGASLKPECCRKCGRKWYRQKPDAPLSDLPRHGFKTSASFDTSNIQELLQNVGKSHSWKQTETQCILKSRSKSEWSSCMLTFNDYREKPKDIFQIC